MRFARDDGAVHRHALAGTQAHNVAGADAVCGQLDPRAVAVHKGGIGAQLQQRAHGLASLATGAGFEPAA